MNVLKEGQVFGKIKAGLVFSHFLDTPIISQSVPLKNITNMTHVKKSGLKSKESTVLDKYKQKLKSVVVDSSSMDDYFRKKGTWVT